MKRLILIGIGLLYCLCGKAQSQEVSLHTPTGVLYGTLQLPSEDVSEKIPLVLIVAGSGPVDRQGNAPSGLQSHVYRRLAETLAQSGIATLRFDKRGVAASRQAAQGVDLRLETYIEDVCLWVDTLAAWDRFGPMVIAGHSEGALIGSVAAQHNARVGALISLCGMGRRMGDILKMQLSVQLPDSLFRAACAVIDSLQTGRVGVAAPPELTALFHPGIQPYLASVLAYDPVEEMARVDVPVLILQGDKDIQLLPINAALLSEARPTARKIVIPDMDHLLKRFDPSAPMSSYADPAKPLHPDLEREIVTFVDSLKRSIL